MENNTKVINENISDLLDTSYESTESSEVMSQEVTPEVLDPITDNSSLDTDISYSRGNIKDLISQGNRAIEMLSMVAQESQHPRAYEVLATLIKNMGELNMNLIDIHKKRNDILPGSTQSNINVDKAVVFTGSTTELIRLIKENKD